MVRRGVNVLWSMNKAIDFDFDSASWNTRSVANSNRSTLNFQNVDSRNKNISTRMQEHILA